MGSGPRIAKNAAFAALALRLVFALVLSVETSHADVLQRKLSPYEQETVKLVLSDTGAKIEREPEGKTVEGIDVVALDVFEPRDPAPQALNWFHVTTQEQIIEREVLLNVGDAYNPSLAAETERNLRQFSQLSVVLLVPTKGSKPDTVRLLVITKDVWSLRVSWEPSVVNGKLTALSLAPSETNLFGTTQTVLGSIFLDANNYWLGGRYFVPRVAGSRIRANVGGNAIFNCATNEFEGATGDFTYGQPLYSSRAEWSWQTAAAWSSRVVRGLSGRVGHPICSQGRANSLRYRVSEQEIVEQPDGTSLVQREVLFPNEFKSERLLGQMVVTRSFNIRNKLNLSTGAEVDWRTNSREATSLAFTPRQRVAYLQQGDGSFANRTVLATLPPDEREYQLARAAYLDPDNLFPRDRRVSPYVQLHAFSNTFVRVINYQTLGLQEDVQVGHDVYLRLYPAFRPLSTRNLVGLFASAAYTAPVEGGVARVLASTEVERSIPEQSDVNMRFAGHFATPDVGVGRFVYDLSFVHQPVRYLSGVYLLDGTGRLRGYRPGVLTGAGNVTFNHEFRSRPVRLFSILAGVSLFHDVGSVFGERFEGFQPLQGAGVGLRILAPQLDRDVFRIDFGFPLAFPPSDHPAAEFTFVATFGQAVNLPVAAPPVLLPQ